MSRVSFENYGKLAVSDLSATEQAGRYSIQAEAEKRILADVLAKADIGSDDTVLDIGCGAGQLLIPLAFVVRSITGIDHPKVVSRLRLRFADPDVNLISGNFMDLTIPDRYSVIIAYGVVNYMTSAIELNAFVDKAVSLLTPGGRLLIGDLPNVDRKKRFLDSATGRAFNDDWKRQMERSATGRVLPELDADPDLLLFNDEVVLGLLLRYRSKGCDAFVLPQPPDLPFGHTREDVLIRARFE